MFDPQLAFQGPVEKLHTPAISDCGACAPETRASLGLARRPTPSAAVHKVTTPSAGVASRAAGVRSKFIKVRVAPGEYAGIAHHADAAGQTMSEYVREQVLAVHRTLDLQAELAALRGLVTAPARSTEGTVALEAVLLLRELAAARDAQILGRVRAQLAQQTQGGRA
ncbi:hypothetical protein D3C72_423380 [compost metagenome]